MNHLAVLWITLALGALVTGSSLVAVLVAPRRTEALFAVLGVLAGATALTTIGAIEDSTGRPDAPIYAIAFLLGFAGGGYALASTSLLRRSQPPIPTPDADSDHPSPPPHVILCRCVEPETYSFTATARMLASLVDEGLIEPPTATLPLLFFAQKARYRFAGGSSPSFKDLKTMSDGVRDALREFDIRVDWATCSGPDRLASKVASALAKGDRRIIVVDLSVAAGSSYERAADEAARIAESSPHATLEFVPALQQDDAVLRMLAARIDAASPPDEHAGVLLVAEGQPREHAERDPEFTARELAFVSRLQMMLADTGRPAESIRTAWAEWGEPDITSELRHLAALGHARLIVVPATRPIESLATRADLPAAIRAARLDAGVEVTIMPAWGADDAVTASIAGGIRSALRGAPER